MNNIGNQQATLTAYIAGLFDGEGHVSLQLIKQRRWHRYKCEVRFTNTDTDLMDIFITFLKEQKIHFHVRTRGGTGKRMVCYDLSINRLNDKLLFLETLKPYMNGVKKKESEFAIRFLKIRIANNNEHVQERNDKGQFSSSNKSSITTEEKLLFKEYKAFKAASTTTRQSPKQLG